MRRIGVITYDHCHLKTQQVLEKVMENDTTDFKIQIFALPFYPRVKRKILFEHRPDQFTGMNISDLAREHKILYKKCYADTEIENDCDLYLLTGSGILSKSAVTGKRIINCHAGIIPLMKGLDAFKWAILEQQPMGNTLHYIDENIDAGEIIAIKETPLYEFDTISDFANRHYRAEIDMLASYEIYLEGLNENKFQNVCDGPIHRRMSYDEEKQLQMSFMKYKEKFAINEEP